jgi:hypothetical protein
VIVTGWGLSETWPGGYTRRQRVRPEMLVRKPAILPHILRGVSLLGVDSVMAPAPARILAGQVRGRVVVEMGR